MSESPRSKKKRTPRQEAQAREREERRAIASAVREREAVQYGHVDIDAAIKDPRNWRYPSAPKGKGPRS